MNKDFYITDWGGAIAGLYVVFFFISLFFGNGFFGALLLAAGGVAAILIPILLVMGLAVPFYLTAKLYRFFKHLR